MEIFCYTESFTLIPRQGVASLTDYELLSSGEGNPAPLTVVTHTKVCQTIDALQGCLFLAKQVVVVAITCAASTLSYIVIETERTSGVANT